MENGLISQDQLEEALRIQNAANAPKRLGEILVENGVLTLDVLLHYLDHQLGGDNKQR